MIRRTTIGVLAVIAGQMTGCAGHGEAAPAPEWAGAGESGEPMAVPADALLPELFGGVALPASALFRSAEGGEVRIVTERTGERSFIVKETVDGAAYSEREIGVTDSGVVLRRITSRDRETITEFRPPMVLIPMNAEPGFTIEQNLMMIVRPMDEPTKIKNRGTATYTLEYAGVSSVTLDGGVVHGASFEERLEASFTGASVKNITRKWYAIGEGMGGLIARQSEESISVLGLPAEATLREIRRAP